MSVTAMVPMTCYREGLSCLLNGAAGQGKGILNITDGQVRPTSDRRLESPQPSSTCSEVIQTAFTAC